MGTVQTTVLGQSFSNFMCKLWMMRTGALLILSHRVKGQGQLWHLKPYGHHTGFSFYLNYHFQTSNVSCWCWEEEAFHIWSRRKMSRSTLSPLQGDVTLCIWHLVFNNILLVFSILNRYWCSTCSIHHIPNSMHFSTHPPPHPQLLQFPLSLL